MNLLRCARVVVGIILSLGVCPSACGGSDSEDESGNGGLGACSVGTPCIVDADCESGTRCNLGECTRIRCLSNDASCDSQAVCESELCIKTSGTASVCWEPTSLRPQGHECSTSEDCEPNLICNKGLNEAVCAAARSIAEGEECSESAVCAEGLICAHGDCHQPLEAGEICDSDEQCAPPYRCRNYEITRSICALAAGAECQYSRECVRPLVCRQDPTSTEERLICSEE